MVLFRRLEIELELCNRVRAEGVVAAFRRKPEMVQDVGGIVAIVPGPIEAERQPSDRGQDDAGPLCNPLLMPPPPY